MIFVVILVIAVALFFILKSQSARTKEVQMPHDAHYEVTIESPYEDRGEGTITQNQDGSISISAVKKSCATLLGASQQIAEEIISICDSTSSYEASKKVGSILMENDIRIKEVEEFCSKVRPIVDKRVRDLIAKDEEWDSLGERDKEDKEKEFQSISMVEFGDNVSPAMATSLSYLTFNRPIYVPLLNEIVSEYGSDNVLTYSQYYGRKKTTISIPDVNYRKPLEELVKVGLAYTGRDMCVEELLSTLTLERLNEIASTETRFTKKDKAIKYLAEQDNITSIIEKNVTLRALFGLLPLPDKFKEFDFEKYSQSCFYYNNLADVLLYLYLGLSPMDYK